MDGYYPGETGGEEVVGNHHPVFLQIPCGERSRPVRNQKIHTRGVTEVGWQMRDKQLSDILMGEKKVLETLVLEGNTPRIYELRLSSLRQVTSDLYTRKKAKRRRSRRTRSPNSASCMPDIHASLI